MGRRGRGQRRGEKMKKKKREAYLSGLGDAFAKHFDFDIAERRVERD